MVFKTEKDSVKATRHIIVEALVYPDLKDPELMKYYDFTYTTFRAPKAMDSLTSSPSVSISNNGISPVITAPVTVTDSLPTVS